MYYMQGRIQRCVREKGGGGVWTPLEYSKYIQNVYKKNWTPRISKLTMVRTPWKKFLDPPMIWYIIYILNQYFIWINFSMSLKRILLSFSENVFPCAIGVQAPRKCSYNIKEIKLHYTLLPRDRTSTWTTKFSGNDYALIHVCLRGKKEIVDDVFGVFFGFTLGFAVIFIMLLAYYIW